ncbi:hypothetical protein HYH02_004235 [Chlamydomonas schloesseri]|uniref:Methyltransferase FkbM domain-containing protein n=1 Tax=Chlamydomonas schloesseri TaxID=2026947 RepID=A0A835WPG7_9CHLO|nr:hypothetical protein HYH02_004235 [Chlamydomonas schloesseri]|eukprot:KAG2450963.1 hypothetical protein HYH02_004235 [Chlamydomonas schloesseri]
MHILRRGCVPGAAGSSSKAPPGLVVDVGANVGYFSMLSASYGCRVTAFEPQHAPRLMATGSMLLNRFNDRVTILPYGLSAAAGSGTVHDQVGSWGLTPVTDASGAHGTQHATAAGGGGGGGGGWLGRLFGWRPAAAAAKERHVAGSSNGDSSNGGSSSGGRPIQLMPLSALVKEDVLLLKIDTEGYEAHVLAGAGELLTRHTVHNVVIEVKGYNDLPKREMLYKLATAAGLKYVYNYEEEYLARVPADEAVDVAAHVTDVSQVVLGRQHSKKLRHEDFWLTREPLNLGA